MIDCARCGTANAEGSRFCNSCGASLVSRVGVQERRVVTALFADLVRSTSLGEKLDPEVVRGLVGEFFELATREIEARGGTVEKFSGDAVMAVFGLPQAHEDDPERSVRAALAIRDGLTSISNEALARQGVTVQARIGIESGEVVVGDPFGGATMATGDAMNVAARLEQQAEPTEIVIGETVWEQVRDVVTAEPLGELALRGRDAGLNGWRVSAIASEVGRPRGVPGLESPLMGRHEELQLLLDAGRRAQIGNKAALFTVLGVPGVGKSRLVREATLQLATEGWSTFRGRCLPYGDGITYWPIAEIVRELAAIGVDATAEETRARLEGVSPDSDVADRLARIIGTAHTSEGAVEGGDKEIAWGFRRLIEHQIASRGPLVLVFEDIHWAEPALLDLIEYLVTWTRDAPLLVICSSRPELLDNRPAWASGHMEASRIHLEPLTEEESRELLGALLAVDDLPAQLRQRVLDRAEGNPLFVEEVVRMLIEEGFVEQVGDRWVAKKEAADVRVPDSVEALIRARLDTLPSPERGTLQAASVVGRVFQRSAVAAIGPTTEATPLQQHLEDAILRDLITEERVPDEPTFRFRHILIRDVAYGTLPKARRADLHRAVADWLRAWFGDRIDEFAEIEAYHLEQAVLLRLELDGRSDPADVERAATALKTSAERAIARDDSRAARSFAERALALDPPKGEARLELDWLLIDSLRRLSEWRRAGELAEPLETEAHRLGRLDLEGRAILARAGDIWISLETADSVAALAELQRARELLEAAGDDRYLLQVLEFLGYGGWWSGDLDEAAKIWTVQREVAHSHGWASEEANAVALLARASSLGGQVDVTRGYLAEATELAQRGPSRLTRALIDRTHGTFLMRIEGGPEAERLLMSALQSFAEFGVHDEQYVALISLGDLRAHEDRWKDALGFYEESFEHVKEHVGYRPEAQRRIAQALVEVGRVDDAVPVAEAALEVTAADDVATVATTKMVLGLVREAQGRDEEAEALLRESVQAISGTQFLEFDELLSLAEFLLRHGRAVEGREMLDAARAEVSIYGPDSPAAPFLERRAAAAAAIGEARAAAG